MIYCFPQLPKAIGPHPDLAKSFNNFGTGPQVAAKIQQLNGLRENFYNYVEVLEKAAPNQLIGELNWMPMFEYIHNGPDLLELGVKVANLPFNFRYACILSPSKDITINDNNEVACTIEMIMSRYSYAFAVLKSCSGHLYKFREAARSKANDQATALIKEIKERIKNAALRIYKMWGTENLILVCSTYEGWPQRQNWTTRVLPWIH